MVDHVGLAVGAPEGGIFLLALLDPSEDGAAPCCHSAGLQLATQVSGSRRATEPPYPTLSCAEMMQRQVTPQLLRLAVGMLLLGAASVGCGDGSSLPGINEIACDDDGACDDVVRLGTRTFSVRCAEPDEAQLGERVGESGSDERFAEARAIEGEDPADFVALRASDAGVDWCASLSYLVGVESTWAQDDDISRVVCTDASIPDEDWCADYREQHAP